MKMDLSKYKKVSTDESAATFRSDDGHEIRIAIGALSPKLRKQLEELPHHYAEGGVVEEESALKKGAKAYSEAVKGAASLALDPLKENVGNAIQGLKDIGSGIKEGFGLKTEEEILGQQREPALAPSAPATLAPEQPAPASNPAPAAPQAPTITGGSVAQSGLAQANQGLMKEAQAIGEQGKQEALIAEQKAKAMEEADALYKQQFQELTNENNALMEDYKAGHINPNRYMESMSSGQKVRSAIGMILSGIGAGLAGQENMAEKYLRQQIDRDVDAQKSNLEKTGNLLKFNQQKFGNLETAREATRANLMGLYAAKLEQAAALSKDPIAQARAMQAAGKLKIESAEMIDKVAKTQAIMQGAKNNPMIAIQAMVPKEQQGEAIKELGEYNNLQSQISQVGKVMDDAFQNTTVGENISSPIQAKKRRDLAFSQLFPIVKAIAGEKMSDSEARLMIEPYLPGFTTSKETVQQAKAKLIGQLQGMVKGRTPLLSGYNIIPDPTKVSGFKPLGK